MPLPAILYKLTAHPALPLCPVSQSCFPSPNFLRTRRSRCSKAKSMRRTGRRLRCASQGWASSRRGAPQPNKLACSTKRQNELRFSSHSSVGLPCSSVIATARWPPPSRRCLRRLQGCFRHLRTMFQELEEIRPFEILKSQGDRVNYLLTKQAKIVAMTCTHAALKRK